MIRPWVESEPITIPQALQDAVGGHPLVAKTLARRGFTDVASAQAFLDPDRYDPTAPDVLPDMDAAVARVLQAVAAREPICVWGDFDVDGQTATTLLVATLRDLGARVTHHIPVRAAESHGVNVAVLQQVIAGGARLILTCDTGIAAHEAVKYARTRGVDLIITDHHDLPGTLPAAHAVINPKRLPHSHPLSTLPGVGVAYKLAEALYRKAGRADEVAEHLDLVALGIVSDIAVQTGDTRYLLQHGLAALRQTERLGLQAMMQIAELNPAWLSEEHIGYVLGPRLNALGRLADANPIVDFLTTTELAGAHVMALQLEGLNGQRKLMEGQILRAAEEQIEREPSLMDHAALVLAGQAWPAGVIGIVAGRLATRYGKPTVLIATPPGEMGRGSARSVEGCNITAALAAHAALLEGYGGHPMAAGLGIRPDRIPEFRHALSRTVGEMLRQTPTITTLAIDGRLPLDEISLDLVDDLGRLAPFGPGNPPLTLVAEGLNVRSRRTVGRNSEHRLVTVEDEAGSRRQVIWWNAADTPLPEGRFDLAYALRASDYRGQRDIQMEWIDARPTVDGPDIAIASPTPTIKVVDHRTAPDPRARLAEVQAQADTVIWREGAAATQLPGHDRYALPRAEKLVVWTVPPGPRESQAAVARVEPATVHIFGVNPDLDRPDVFLQRLAGLVKHALNVHGGQVEIPALAAATAHREDTVRAGLTWLAERGHISLQQARLGNVVQLAAGDGSKGEHLDAALADLQALLAETAAYRAHFRQAEANTLIPDSRVQQPGT